VHVLSALDRCLYPGDTGIEHRRVVAVPFVDPVNNQGPPGNEDLRPVTRTCAVRSRPLSLKAAEEIEELRACHFLFPRSTIVIMRRMASDLSGRSAC
jgi:hypothetical protein